MIDKELSKQASAQDQVLLRAPNPTEARLLTVIGKKWRLKRLPFLGTVVSDPDIIRTLMDSMRENATMGFWGQETASTGFAVMNPMLQQIISETLTHERMDTIRESVVLPMLYEAEEELHAGKQVDVVELVSRVCYLSMWKALGLSEDRLKKLDFNMIVRTLRDAAEVLMKTKHPTQAEQRTADSRLLFFTTILSEDYNDTSRASLPSRLREAGYPEKQAVSLTQRAFLSGADSVIRFIPRMTALFVKTRYIDHLTAEPNHLWEGLDEAYRVICPIPTTPLNVNEPLTLRGVTVKAGEKTLLSMVGVSQKFGPFDPFRRGLPESVAFGKPFPLSIGFGDLFARMMVEEFSEFLIRANETELLVVAGQASDDKGHVGSYKKLILELEEEDLLSAGLG